MRPGIPDPLEIRRARREAIAHITGRSLPSLRVSHYELLALLGTGGFGTVWKARDIRLGRTVALKRLHGRDAASEGWLLRIEARVQAQIEHPNVVSVFEIFEEAGDLFAVFEYVRGQTLARWLESQRTTEEIDRVFTEAARGLAAVHAAGLAHGDFKPRNVIVTADLRAKLLDFGLSTPIDVPTERRGGTPAYMSPEVRRGGPPTPAGDQYALCLSWLEALGYDPSSSRRIGSSRKLAALRRGAHPEAHARWPTMHALLDHLERPDPRAKLVWFGGAVSLVVALSFVGRDAPPTQCEHELAPWPSRDAGRMIRQFEAVAPSHGGHVAARVNEALDAWIPKWQEAWTHNCEATPSADRGATAACLEDHRRRVHTLIETFRQPTRAVVHSAAAAAHALPRTHDCFVSPGTETDARPENATRLYAMLHDALALARTGDEDGADRLLRALIREAEHIGWLGLQAEATLELGNLRHGARRDDDALARTEEAYFLAREAGAIDVARRAAGQMTAYHAQRLDEAAARRWASQAAALDDPEHVPGSLRAYSSNALGVLEGARGSLAEARRHFEEGLEQLAADPVPAPRTHAAILANLSEVEIQSGDPQKGFEIAERAVAIHEDAFGPEDRHIVGVLFNAGKAAIAAGAMDRARALLERAVALAERHLRPDHPHLAVSRLFLADVLVEQGAWPDARPHAQAAVDALVDLYGADDPRMESAYRTLAHVLAKTGDLPEGERMAIRAAELAREGLGPDNVSYAAGLQLLGSIRFARGACDLAAAAYDEAAAILARSDRSRDMLQSRAEEEAKCRRSAVPVGPASR